MLQVIGSFGRKVRLSEADVLDGPARQNVFQGGVEPWIIFSVLMVSLLIFPSNVRHFVRVGHSLALVSRRRATRTIQLSTPSVF